MYCRTRRDDVVVFGVTIIYFGFVHGSSLGRRRRLPLLRNEDSHSRRNQGASTNIWFPKEGAVAILFAVATAIPAWSRLQGEDSSQYTHLSICVICFAFLCWLNCVAIEQWETKEGLEPTFTHMHATTEWIGRNLSTIALVVCGVAVLLSGANGLLSGPISLSSVFQSAG